jgi:hypothetical protein
VLVATKGKRKTTFAKLDREGKLRERRAIKQAKKDARKLGSAAGVLEPSDPLSLDASDADDAGDAGDAEAQPAPLAPAEVPAAPAGE